VEGMIAQFILKKGKCIRGGGKIIFFLGGFVASRFCELIYQNRSM
jgi:hypothetical protein